ncbi:MAG: hypothetical protein KDC76_13265 [Bacteroidetes bacterium]|nr:hypothetical protein [Bacteroidota bacterium]
MRNLLIVLFISFGIPSVAQNWTWFPKDSLRIYQNPVQHSYRYTGIDFRDFEQHGDTALINLANFSLVDTIYDPPTRTDAWVAYILLGNSNYGNHIVETDDRVELIFQHKHQPSDTLLFHKTFLPAMEWTIFQNDAITLTGKFKSLENHNGDSILTIGLSAFSTASGSSKSFSLKIQKTFGLTSSPVFFDLLYRDLPIDSVKSVQWQTYRELTEFEVYTCTPGTVFETAGSFRNEPDRIQFNQRDSFLGTNGNTIKYSTSYRSTTVGPGHDPIHHEDKGLITFKTKDTSAIINPQPGRITIPDNQNGWLVSLNPLGGYFTCDRYTFNAVDYGGGSEYFEVSNDTIYSLPTIGIPPIFDYYKAHYLVGIGAVRQDEIYCTYLKIPGACELGERDWRFTSVHQLVFNKLVVHPNPASTSVQLPDQFPPITAIKLVSPTGQILFCDHSSNRIELPSVSNGIYTLWVEAADGVYINRLMIQH